MTSSVHEKPLVVFLDANVLAKPVTRTLLMVGGQLSGFHPLWSAAAETEASRHMRPNAMQPAMLRERFELRLSPTGSVGDRFAETKGADRQILADAEQSGAAFLVTEDVDDFAYVDLDKTMISAVNPDLFLSHKLSDAAYSLVLELFVERQLRPPTTLAGFHSAIARRHRRLFAAKAELYEATPLPSAHSEPAVIFRGTRCLLCEEIATDPIDATSGSCRSCAWQLGQKTTTAI